MISPVMNGNVPASTPALDQPIPFSMLETTTVAPNAPVRVAVAASRLRRVIMSSVSRHPADVRSDLALSALGRQPSDGRWCEGSLPPCAGGTGRGVDREYRNLRPPPS